MSARRAEAAAPYRTHDRSPGTEAPPDEPAPPESAEAAAPAEVAAPTEAAASAEAAAPTEAAASAEAAQTAEAASPDRGTSAPARRFGRADLVTILSYLGLAATVMYPLWTDPTDLRLVASLEDHYFNEWNLAYAAHALTDGVNPLFTSLMNPPDGVNIMANTSNLAIGFVLAPVTLTLGPAVSLALALTLGLAATAASWYWVLSRWLLPAANAPAARDPRPAADPRPATYGRPAADARPATYGRPAADPRPATYGRPATNAQPAANIRPAGHWAAALAGGLIGFSPSLVGHAGGTHLQFVAQFLLPFIVWRVTRLADRPVREGVTIGLLVTCQLFLGEEILLLAALAVGVMVAVRLAGRPWVGWTTVRRFLGGTAVTAGVVLVLAGYPLWTQFFGRQSYSGISWLGAAGTPLPGWTSYSTESLAGDDSLNGLAWNSAEQNGFLGWGVVLLAICSAVWLWRRSGMARGLTVTSLVFLLLAAGWEIVWTPGEPGVPGPWQPLARLPVFEAVLPARFALVTIVCVALLLALAAHRLMRRSRLVVLALAAVALLPIAPTPLTVWDKPPVPEFFTAGLWKQYVRPGHTLVVAPRPSCYYGDPMRWQYLTDFEFRINSGFFVGPVGPDREGTYTPTARPSERILERASGTNQPQPVSADDQRAARDDLHAWRADAVVLDPRMPGADAVRATADLLYGVPGKLVGGIWVWDVA